MTRKEALFPKSGRNSQGSKTLFHLQGDVGKFFQKRIPGISENHRNSIIVRAAHALSSPRLPENAPSRNNAVQKQRRYGRLRSGKQGRLPPLSGGGENENGDVRIETRRGG